MLNTKLKSFRAAAIGGAAIIAALGLAPVVSAQRGEDWEWPGNYQRLHRINAGTFVTVRTTQGIVSNRTDGRIFSGVVAEDVWDDYGRLAVPAIPRGSRVELLVRTAPDGDLILDLESVYAHGQRYALSAVPERIESGNGSRRDNDQTAEFVGGGALLGSIIGAIAGGGKGAAIGAGAGAATGLGLAFRGQSVRVPAGSLLTFRLDRGLVIGASHNRDTRNRYSGPDNPSQQRR
jgi:hypothetical protein